MLRLAQLDVCACCRHRFEPYYGSNQFEHSVTVGAGGDDSVCSADERGLLTRPGNGRIWCSSCHDTKTDRDGSRKDVVEDGWAARMARALGMFLGGFNIAGMWWIELQ